MWKRFGIRKFERKQQRQRIYIVPTVFGFISGLLVLGVAIFASATNSAAALVLCAILLLAGMLAIFQTNITVSQIKLLRLESEDVPAGHAVPLRVTLLNYSKQRKYMLNVGVAHSFWSSNKNTVLIESIDAGSSSEVLMYLPAHSRGVYGVPTLTVSSKFPLGVCRAWLHLKEPKDFVVYPEPKGESRQVVDPHQFGGDRRIQLRDDSDFWGHRAYRQGDSLMHVDWKAHARGRGMQTKQFSFGTTPSRAIRLADAHGESLETKLQQVSLWVHDAYEKDEAFSVELPMRTLSAGQGTKQFRMAMRALAEIEP